jgi:muramoyltetrapeptide carboxypeptidase
VSSRRRFLRALGLGAAGAPLAGAALRAQAVPEAVLPAPGLQPLPRVPVGALPPRPLIKPRRLRPGAVIGLVAPAGHLDRESQVEDTRRELELLGFRSRPGRHVLARHGYLAGTDEQRAEDLMAMFLDDDVDAVLALRGGWGCARLLPLLDYEAIRAHPKPLIGYSDITALLLAVYARSGVVTFHGPVGRSTWNEQTVESFRQVLVRRGKLYLSAVPPETARRDGYQPIRSGMADGPLVGGNLSVVSALAGTPYLPDFAGHVVFFEEVSEDIYRIDRMLTQLRLSGAFDEAAAVVFGQCRSCATAEVPGDGLAWLLRDHFGRGRRPAWTGAPIGHVSPVYTLPIGVPFFTDAALGTLVMQEPAVA